MTHIRLVDFLDEYNIRQPEDFSSLRPFERHSFIKRLNGFAERERERLEEYVMEDIELKMHYYVSRHPKYGWQNIPNETLARKLAFFSGRTIITFPFHEVRAANDDIKSLLTTLCVARPFMEEDMLNLFPSVYKGEKINPAKFNKDYGLVSANFKNPKLEKQFNEDYRICKNIYMPVFKNVSANDVVTIRKENELLYRDLELRLAELLSGKAQSEEKILILLREIDKHVTKLIVKFEEIKKACDQKNSFRILGLVKIIVAMVAHPGDAISNILKLSEGNNYAIDAINDAVTFGNIKADDYYLFWLINNPKENKIS